MTRSRVGPLVMTISLLGVAAAPRGLPAQGPDGGAPPAPPPARAVPGLTVADPFPAGCVGCHVNRPDLGIDPRLSTLMRRLAEGADPKLLAAARAATAPGIELTGRHPAVDEALADIPAGCMGCHDRASSTAPELARLLHLVHLSGGDQNHFMTLFQGECTHCHKLDPGSGAWSVPSGPEP